MEYCLSLPDAEQSTPFNDDILVYKVGGKVFSLASISNFDRFAVKCDPDLAQVLRDRYQGITPAFHLNKKHWNDIYVNRGYSSKLLRAQIAGSYKLVIERNVTPKSLKEELIDRFRASGLWCDAARSEEI